MCDQDTLNRRAFSPNHGWRRRVLGEGRNEIGSVTPTVSGSPKRAGIKQAT